ncbi:MAG: PaaI family thioesterase, partial [Deltaproteobacteria bacterium]|nr:PaaI family thioesterase [Deltaproteobacteria bacterium]
MDKTLGEERISSLKEEFFQGFIKTCGINLVSLEHGWAESRLEITGAHSQQDGFAHAGVMATMADHTAGYAAFSVVTEDYRILTLEFKINFL